MTERPVKIIVTEDGSPSIYLPEINESFHSTNGAYRESVHVFILYGLEAWFSRYPGKFPIRIFEVGFGTGLNAWLSLVWAEQYSVPVLYHSLEPFPLSEDVFTQLDYSGMDDSLFPFNPYFKKLHLLEWGEGQPVSEFFNFKKDSTTLQQAQLYPSDVVFFDAFSPKKQPELWEPELLKKVVDSMNTGGVFVTYCAASRLKRTLVDLGLELDQVPGPPGKKEMTRGWKLK